MKIKIKQFLLTLQYHFSGIFKIMQTIDINVMNMLN
jgi:hypothetical protein